MVKKKGKDLSEVIARISAEGRKVKNHQPETFLESGRFKHLQLKKTKQGEDWAKYLTPKNVKLARELVFENGIKPTARSIGVKLTSGRKAIA
ncbi:hypothetical protein KJ780_05250 [Candidatus Micrarchaeota archaeon]|nr:hypothetical protein [Candidatus Micrarchaeota archaeon]